MQQLIVVFLLQNYPEGTSVLKEIVQVRSKECLTKHRFKSPNSLIIQIFGCLEHNFILYNLIHSYVHTGKLTSL